MVKKMEKASLISLDLSTGTAAICKNITQKLSILTEISVLACRINENLDSNEVVNNVSTTVSVDTFVECLHHDLNWEMAFNLAENGVFLKAFSVKGIIDNAALVRENFYINVTCLTLMLTLIYTLI